MTDDQLQQSFLLVSKNIDITTDKIPDDLLQAWSVDLFDLEALSNLSLDIPQVALFFFAYGEYQKHKGAELIKFDTEELAILYGKYQILLSYALEDRSEAYRIFDFDDEYYSSTSLTIL